MIFYASNRMFVIASDFKKILRFAALLLCLSAASGAQAFVISDVRVEGLQRIGAGAVFGAIPFNVWDEVNEEGLRQIIRALFRTENFDDVKVLSHIENLLLKMI